MNEINEVIGGFLKPDLKEGDHTNEDGLLVCGRCGEPKQFSGHWLGKTAKINCPCRCDRERDEADKLRRQKEQAIERCLAAYPPGSSYIDARFTNADDCHAIRVAKRYAEQFETEYQSEGYGFIFYGSVGTGKTFAAACACNEIIEKGHAAIFTSIPRVINRVQSSFEGRQEYLDSLSRAPLLVLDDETQSLQKKSFTRL